MPHPLPPSDSSSPTKWSSEPAFHSGVLLRRRGRDGDLGTWWGGHDSPSQCAERGGRPGAQGPTGPSRQPTPWEGLTGSMGTLNRPRGAGGVQACHLFSTKDAQNQDLGQGTSPGPLESFPIGLGRGMLGPPHLTGWMEEE